MVTAMTRKLTTAVGAAAVGSAAIAAALLYAGKNRRKPQQSPPTPAEPKTPSGELPQTD